MKDNLKLINYIHTNLKHYSFTFKIDHKDII